MSKYFKTAMEVLSQDHHSKTDEWLAKAVRDIRDDQTEEQAGFETLMLVAEILNQKGLQRLSAEIVSGFKLQYLPVNAGKSVPAAGATIDLTAHPLGEGLPFAVKIGEAAMKALGMGPYSLFRMQNADVLANAVHGAIMAHALHFNRPSWPALQRELADMGMGYLTENQLEVKVETSWRVLGTPDSVAPAGFSSRVDLLLMNIRERLRQP